MNNVKDLNEILNHPDLLEILADIEHQRWANWQDYLQNDVMWDYYEKNGTFRLLKKDYDRYQTLINTPYNELSEKLKESDRVEARKSLVAIIEFVFKLKHKENIT